MSWMKVMTVAGIAASTSLTAPTLASAQSAEGEVRSVVERLFTAMREADGEGAAKLFHPEARLASVSVREGRAVVDSDSAERFIAAVGGARSEVWDERIRNLRVELFGDLAIAWMDYSFFLGGTLSHCGVNVFELVRAPDGWRIFGITDTRRQTDCE